MRYKYIKGTLVTKHNIRVCLKIRFLNCIRNPCVKLFSFFKRKTPKNNKEALFAILKIKVHLARQSLKKKDLYNRYGNMYKRYNDKAVQRLALPPFQEL